MRFSGGQSLLHFYRQGPGKPFQLRIVLSQSAALKQWTASSRISPLLLLDITHLGLTSPAEDDFRGDQFVLLLGPIHPELVLPHCAKGCKAWLSLGLFNLLVCSSQRRDLTTLQTLDEIKHVPFELWALRNGQVLKMIHSD